MNQSNSVSIFSELRTAGHENVNLWPDDRRGLHHDSRMLVYLRPPKSLQFDADVGSRHDLWLRSDTLDQREHSNSGIAVSLVPVVDTDRFRIREQLEDMKKLKDGWADGMQSTHQWDDNFGKALPADGVNWLANQMETHYHDDLPYPYIYPTPEGGVQIEWSCGPYEASLEIDLSKRVGAWICTNVESGQFSDYDLKLTNIKGWEWLQSQLEQLGDTAA